MENKGCDSFDHFLLSWLGWWKSAAVFVLYHYQLVWLEGTSTRLHQEKCSLFQEVLFAMFGKASLKDILPAAPTKLHICRPCFKEVERLGKLRRQERELNAEIEAQVKSNFSHLFQNGNHSKALAEVGCI